MIHWDDSPARARWWYEEPRPRPSAGAAAHGGDGMAMHRKYAGWSQLRPAPRAPWYREALELILGLAMMGLMLAGVAAAIMAAALMMG